MTDIPLYRPGRHQRGGLRRPIHRVHPTAASSGAPANRPYRSGRPRKSGRGYVESRLTEATPLPTAANAPVAGGYQPTVRVDFSSAFQPTGRTLQEEMAGMSNMFTGKPWLWIAIAIAAGVGWYLTQQLTKSELPAGIASGNGRMEAVAIDIAARSSGRIREILVQEGDVVTSGQILVHMDTLPLQAQLREARALLQRSQIAKQAAQSGVSQREAERSAAQAVLAQRATELDAAQRRLERSEQLAERNAVSLQTLDDDRARLGQHDIAQRQGRLVLAVLALGERSRSAECAGIILAVDGHLYFRLLDLVREYDLEVEFGAGKNVGAVDRIDRLGAGGGCRKQNAEDGGGSRLDHDHGSARRFLRRGDDRGATGWRWLIKIYPPPMTFA